MKIVKSRVFCCLLCFMVMGCEDKNTLSDEDTLQKTVDGVFLHLAFSVGGSRVGETADLETPGVGFENEIHNLYVFTENGGKRVFYPFRNVVLEEGKNGLQTAELKLPVDIQIGETMTFYLGANLNDEQAEAFCKDNEPYRLPSSTDDDYNIIEAFAPGIETENHKPRTDIAMFCTKSESAEITFEDDNTAHVSIQFDLKRLVAKVLVTCKGNGEYVPLKEGESFAANGGWIRLEDVYFLVNSLNRTSFIMEQGKDPNNDLTVYVDEDGYNGFQVGRDFVYKESYEQYQIIKYFKRVSLYDEEKIPGGYDPGEALYCPENLFEVNETKKDILENYKNVWPMITHVSVAAKYTPGKLMIEEGLIDYVLEKIGSKEVIDKEDLKITLEEWKEKEGESVWEVICPNEYISQTLLTESLKKAEYYQEGSYSTEEKGFPQHTYFYYNNPNVEIGDKFYTYGAVIKELGESYDSSEPEELGNYLPYTQGWGYYYTYIDDLGTGNGVASYKVGQVRRNKYYILTIESFSRPGTSIHEGGYIDVHTRVDEWKDGGMGKIELN